MNEIEVKEIILGMTPRIRARIPPSNRHSDWTIFFEKSPEGLKYAGAYTHDDNPQELEPPRSVIQKAKEAVETYLNSRQLRLPF